MKSKNWMNGFEEQDEKAHLGFDLDRFDVSGRLRLDPRSSLLMRMMMDDE